MTPNIDYKIDLKDFPDDSRALYELLASESDDLGVVEQQMYKNKFYQWLNKEGTAFSKAKNKLIKKKLLLPENWVLQAPFQIELKYTLEYICCQLIEHYLRNDTMLKKALATKSAFLEFRKALKPIQKHLKNPHLSFGNMVLEQLFKLVSDEIINDERKNIHTSRKNMPTLLRDTFTKRAIGMLHPYYARQEDITNNFITDTAIAITEQFFHTKSDNHLAQISLKIKADYEENSLLLNMTVEDLLIYLHSKKKSRVQK